MAKAATLTIVEAEHIVPIGSIDPNDVDLPGIFVDRVVQSTEEKHIELLKLREPETNGDETLAQPKNAAQEKRNRIGRRAAEELKEGYYVNLGVGKEASPILHHARCSDTSLGIPTLAVSFLPPQRQVWVQSENGILGMGPYPTKDEVDA